MNRFRLHIGTLLLLIVFLGIGFAVLRQSSDLWEIGFFNVTMGILSTSILLAIHARAWT
jgi:hypothetical protein